MHSATESGSPPDDAALPEPNNQPQRRVLYRLDDIVKHYGGRTVLAIERLEIEAGTTLALLGPSGAGKSTLLRLLNFLEQPARGTIRFEGQVVSSPDLATMRSITTVFQHPPLLDTTVRRNVAYGLRLRGRRDPAAVEQVLATLGLHQLADAPARTLSGGEMQRVALARALAIKPRVLLLDEPTANLDPANVAILEAAVRDLPARQGTTIVLATHNLHQARRLAASIAILLDGQLVETGPSSEILTAARDARTRAFLSGEMIY